MPDSEELVSAKQTHHAQLAAEHKRLADFHDAHAGGRTANADAPADSQIGSFFGGLMEHKFWVIGGIMAIIAVFFVIIPAIKSGGSNNTANSGANAAPDLTQGGFLPSDISSALDNINQSINGLANQIGSGTTTSPPTPPAQPPPTPKPGPGPKPGPKPPNTQKFVTVASWSALNTKWNSTLLGIAQHEGITLNRIETLNPGIKNPNLIFAGEKVRVK